MSDAPTTILVIEDEVFIRESLCDYLEDRGFRVLGAENGRVGLEIFERESPDLVLTDLRMPEVDGLEVLRCAVALSPSTPLIVVSGTGNIADSVQALRLGAWDYVLKPINDLSIILHVVEKALERARLQRENVAKDVQLRHALKQLREDEDAGRKMQMKLLPPSPFMVEPYTFAQRVEPSTGLSGDFMDYFVVNEEDIVFYSADVSGHGISSALVTVLLRSFMRTQIDKYLDQGDVAVLHPDRLLTRWNRELIEFDLSKHITMFYAVLRRASNTLSYGNGGQFPPPILFSRSGVEVLRDKGTAVGLFPDAQFETVSLDLPESFFMTVYSDGILEVIPEETLDGKLAFLQTLNTPATIATFMDRAQSIPELPDDVAVLSVAR